MTVDETGNGEICIRLPKIPSQRRKGRSTRVELPRLDPRFVSMTRNGQVKVTRPCDSHL